MERIEALINRVTVSTVYYEHNELGRIEHFINNEIASDQFHDPATIDETLIRDVVKILNAEAERIKREMDTVIASFTLAERQQYIQFHHHAIMQLAGNLLNYVSADELLVPETTSVIGRCAQHTLRTLDSLMRFLEMRFSSYIDVQARLPINYKSIIAHVFKSQMLAIEQDLRFKKVEDQLIDIALSPVTDFINAADVPYHRVAYLNRFTEALSNLELTGEDTWTDVTEMALVRLNLNTRAFHEYLDRKLRELCQANTEPDECIEVLSEFLKDIHANTEISPISYDPASPQVSTPIKARIDREISYQERRLEMQTTMDSRSEENDNVKPAVDLSITIEELALLVFVLREIGVIKNKNQKKLFEFFTRNFRTRLTAKGSADYFKQRYYLPEPRSLESVAAMLEKVILYIRKMPA